MRKESKQALLSSLRKRFYSWSAVFLFCLNLFLFGCGRGNEEIPGAPLFIGIGYDMSRSVNAAHLPQFTSNHIDQVIKPVNKRGGTVTFGVIDERAFEPLAKLEVLKVSGRLDERARVNQKNQESEKTFKQDVVSKIAGPRNARSTDIKGSIARFSLFFNEPTIPPNAQKVAIFISDGIDTGPWRKLSSVRLPDGVKVYVVGMERTLAEKLFGKAAVPFESIDSALDNLNSFK